MDFQVPCECGEHVVVSEGAAGTRLQCPCGRTITVPSLAELRRQSGLTAYRPRPHLVIENMLAHGELPTLTACSCCAEPTDGTADVIAECEKTWRNEPASILWILSFLVFGIWGILLVILRGEGEVRGTNVILHLPVRICGSCRKQLMRNLVVGRTFDLIAIVFAIAGILVMIFWTLWGGVFLLGSLLALLAETIVRKQRQARIKTALALEPTYRQLLDDFPKATLLLNFNT